MKLILSFVSGNDVVNLALNPYHHMQAILCQLILGSINW